MQRGELGALRADVINRARRAFAHIDEVAEINTKKLDELYARVFGAERALVRTQFVSGTHALAAVLFGILRPGDQLVSITGAPYDTMQTVIGWAHESVGSLKEFGVGYDELPMRDGRVDLDGIDRIVTAQTKMALVQRSRGYSEREPLSIEDIRTVSARIKAAIRTASYSSITATANSWIGWSRRKSPRLISSRVR